MKDAPEAEESLEVDVEDSDDIFDTPSLLWLQKKKSFMKKARDYQFWGRQGSKQRVIAMDSFRKYCVQSMDLTAVSPSLSMDAVFDMQNIIHEQRLLPMPNYVRRKLVDVSKEDEHDPELQMSRVIRELDNLCDDALAHYEKSEWSKLHEIEEDTCHLRALRKCIYDRGQKYDLSLVTCEYDFEVRNFLQNYEEILSSREVGIWKEKLRETISFATECLGYEPDGGAFGYTLDEPFGDEDDYATEDERFPEDDSAHTEVEVSIEAKEFPAKKT
jgi:hypothetical protein